MGKVLINKSQLLYCKQTENSIVFYLTNNHSYTLGRGEATSEQWAKVCKAALSTVNSGWTKWIRLSIEGD